MISVALSVLALLAHARFKELAANRTSDMLDKLVDRAINALHLRQVNLAMHLDNATLGKAEQRSTCHKCNDCDGCVVGVERLHYINLKKQKPQSKLTDGGCDFLSGIPGCLHGASSARRLMSGRNHYQVLGVTSRAEQHEIRSAYRILALKHHPDKGGDQKRFQEIQQAYDTLRNVAARSSYDKNINSNECNARSAPKPSANSWTRSKGTSKGSEDLYEDFWGASAGSSSVSCSDSSGFEKSEESEEFESGAFEDDYEETSRHTRTPFKRKRTTKQRPSSHTKHFYPKMSNNRAFKTSVVRQLLEFAEVVSAAGRKKVPDMALPVHLSEWHRYWVHRIADTLDLVSYSIGKGCERFVIVKASFKESTRGGPRNRRDSRIKNAKKERMRRREEYKRRWVDMRKGFNRAAKRAHLQPNFEEARRDGKRVKQSVKFKEATGRNKVLRRQKRKA